MAKFRKKPVVIEAFRLNGRGLVAEDWFWDAVTRNDIIMHCFGKHYPDPAWCEIKTLEGTMIANAGDYIIQGVNGEIYPCKADIFQKTYTEDKPKTNADRIRSMTDDELNELFREIYNAGVEDASAYEWGQRTNGFEWMMEWLQQPAKGEKDKNEVI